jgi:DNA polymerase-3 subunit beta
MKLVVKREPFARALAAAATIANPRNVRPNLRNALLVAQKEGAVEIHATDLEVGLRHRVAAESVKDPVSLCLPCQTLAGLLGECVEELVSLETEGAKALLTLGRDRFELVGQESSDFPEVPDLGDGPSVSVPAPDLAAMIDRTVFAAAREQGRYAINGVLIQVKEKLFEMVATDGRRLAHAKRKLKGASAMEEGVIVPLKMMQEIRRLCDQIPEGQEAGLAVRGRTILCRGGDMTLSSVLVEGIFPKYQAVIPKDADREVTFNRETLSLALRKASYLASDETRTVSLTFTPGTCLLEARCPDKGQAAVTIEAEYTGDKLAIAFNPQYLQDCLKVLSAEKVRMELKDPSRPGVLREGTDYLYVVMPVTPKD